MDSRRLTATLSPNFAMCEPTRAASPACRPIRNVRSKADMSSSTVSTCAPCAFQVAHRGLAGREHLRIHEPVADAGEPPDPQAPHRDVARIVGRAPGASTGRPRRGRRSRRSRRPSPPRSAPSGRCRTSTRRDRPGARAATRPSVGLSPTMPQHAAGSADRAAAVGAERERPLAGGDRRGGATRRAARGAREVPRIARGAEERAVGQRLVAELRRGRLADQDGAGLAEPPHRDRVLGRAPGRRRSTSPSSSARPS